MCFHDGVYGNNVGSTIVLRQCKPHVSGTSNVGSNDCTRTMEPHSSIPQHQMLAKQCTKDNANLIVSISLSLDLS